MVNKYKMNIDKTAIDNFWDWFLIHKSDFGGDFYNDKLINELDNRIKKMGPFSWELGPGKTCDNQFVISPNGDADLLPITKEIVSRAKALPDWEFYFAKPQKQWNLEFLFENEEGLKIKVSATDWKYVLLAYEDGTFDIIICPTGLKNCTENDKFLATEILLDGILGEEKRMICINAIDIVREFEAKYVKKTNEIKDLANHLEKLLSEFL